MLHNPLFLINSISIFFKNCHIHSVHGIQHHLFYFKPCVALLHVLCGTSVFASTVSSLPSPFFTLQQAMSVAFLLVSALITHMNGLPYKALYLHKYHSHLLLCLLLCSQNSFHWDRKAIHFIVDLPVKCSVGQPLSTEAECSDGKCCCISEL